MSASGSEAAKKVICARKNYPGNRSDIGWQHGMDVEGDSRKVKCNYCSKVVCGGIFRFKHHLAGTRENVEACVGVPDEVRETVLKVICTAKDASVKKKRLWSVIDNEDESVGGVEGIRKQVYPLSKKSKTIGASSQSNLNQVFKKKLKEEVGEQVARFFYKSAIPFNCIKNAEFFKMCDVIGQYGKGYISPSYYDVREKLLKREKTRIEVQLQEFKDEWKEVGCTIMSDGWTDKRRRSICNFLVNSPKGTVFLYSLDTSEISKTADKVLEMLEAVVDYVGEHNVVQIVADNAANYKAAGLKLMEKRKHLYWTPCAAHCIDLMLEDFEKHIKLHKDTIIIGRKVTTYVYGRTTLISLLRNFTNGRDLIRPAATRFATSYLTLSCLNGLKGALINMFSSNEWKAMKFSSTKDGKQVAKKVLDNRFWKNIVLCLQAAAPLIKVLHVVDSDTVPAMGFIYEEMNRAKEKIKVNFNNAKKSYEPILKIIEDRWEGQLHRPLHAAGYYLNPRWHYSPSFKKHDVKRDLYSCLERLVPDRETKNMIDRQLIQYHKATGTFGIHRAKDNRDKMAPADWWLAYGDDCLELRDFAIRILSLTGSSSGCERNWSAFEMVHTKRRNRLHQKKMNDLVYVMANLKLQNKQQKKPVVVEFDDIHSDDEWITEPMDVMGLVKKMRELSNLLPYLLMMLMIPLLDLLIKLI